MNMYLCFNAGRSREGLDITMERLDKILASSGAGSRSDVKAFVRAGRVKINGCIIKDPQVKVADTDIVLLDGRKINTAHYHYFMLNKPTDTVSSTKEEAGGAKTVIDLFKSEKLKNLFPVGRLDKDTTGLLLVTDDGELGHRLTSPAHHVDKCYEATVHGVLTGEHIKRFAEGFSFKDFSSEPAKLEIIKADPANNLSRARVTIHEGKFHQIKRMFLKIGCEVKALKRIAMGALVLDEGLRAGQYRALTPEEIELLRGTKRAEQLLAGIEAVIFDLDGTLVDSMWMWKSIDREYLARFGLELPEDLQSCIEGMSFSETAAYFKERFGIEDDIEKMKNDWNSMAYDYYCHKVPLKAGVEAFLKLLRENNIKMGIATSNSRELAEAVIAAHGIDKYISELHISCEVEHGKPAPDIYLLVADRLGVAPEKCLVFEDILQGIDAGNAAGMRTCAVEDDYSADILEEKRKHADYCYTGFDEILRELCGER